MPSALGGLVWMVADALSAGAWTDTLAAVGFSSTAPDAWQGCRQGPHATGVRPGIDDATEQHRGEPHCLVDQHRRRLGQALQAGWLTVRNMRGTFTGCCRWEAAAEPAWQEPPRCRRWWARCGNRTWCPRTTPAPAPALAAAPTPAAPHSNVTAAIDNMPAAGQNTRALHAADLGGAST